MGIREESCSIFDENKEESLCNNQAVVARKPFSIAECSGLRYLVQGVEKSNFHLCFSAKVTTVSFLTKVVLLFSSAITGVGLGTVVSALLVGPIVHAVSPFYHVLDRWLFEPAALEVRK